MGTFNEATRVQMPAMVHLTRLGYQYIGKIHEEDAHNGVYDPHTNILLKVFKEQFCRLIQVQAWNLDQILSYILKDVNDDVLGIGFY